MKRFYNDPTMSVSLFEKENVVTSSGTTKNAAEAGTSFITNELGNDATVLNFIF